MFIRFREPDDQQTFKVASGGIRKISGFGISLNQQVGAQKRMKADTFRICASIRKREYPYIIGILYRIASIKWMILIAWQFDYSGRRAIAPRDCAMIHYYMPQTRLSVGTIARIAAAWPAMVEAIADGALIRSVIAAAGFSSSVVRAYRAMDREADAAWQRAKEESADAYFDEIRAMTTNIKHIDPASARVNMDGLKWLAAKRNPRIYSDKSQMDVNVRTVDLTAIILAANARLAAAREPLIIEHEVPALELLR